MTELIDADLKRDRDERINHMNEVVDALNKGEKPYYQFTLEVKEIKKLVAKAYKKHKEGK